MPSLPSPRILDNWKHAGSVQAVEIIPPAVELANLIAAVGAMAPIPYVKGVASVVVILLSNLEKYHKNKQAVLDIAKDIVGIITIVRDIVISYGEQTPDRVRSFCVEFQSYLTDLLSKVDEMARKTGFGTRLKRFFTANQVEERLNGYRKRIDELRSNLNLAITLEAGINAGEALTQTRKAVSLLKRTGVASIYHTALGIEQMEGEVHIFKISDLHLLQHIRSIPYTEVKAIQQYHTHESNDVGEIIEYMATVGESEMLKTVKIYRGSARQQWKRDLKHFHMHRHPYLPQLYGVFYSPTQPPGLVFHHRQGNAAAHRKDGVHMNRTNLLDFYNHGASVFHCQKNVLIVQVAELSTYFVGLKNPVFESLASALKHLELTLHSDGSSNQSNMRDGALRVTISAGTPLADICYWVHVDETALAPTLFANLYCLDSAGKCIFPKIHAIIVQMRPMYEVTQLQGTWMSDDPSANQILPNDLYIFINPYLTGDQLTPSGYLSFSPDGPGITSSKDIERMVSLQLTMSLDLREYELTMDDRAIINNIRAVCGFGNASLPSAEIAKSLGVPVLSLSGGRIEEIEDVHVDIDTVSVFPEDPPSYPGLGSKSDAEQFAQENGKSEKGLDVSVKKPRDRDLLHSPVAWIALAVLVFLPVPLVLVFTSAMGRRMCRLGDVAL